MWPQGLLPQIMSALAGGTQLSVLTVGLGTRRAFWLEQVLAAAVTCCLTWVWRKLVEWHVSLLGVSPIFGLYRAAEVVQHWREEKKKTEHRRRRSGVAKEAEPPQSWSASNICCSHFSDMCILWATWRASCHLARWHFIFSVMAAFRVLSLSRLSQFFSLLPLFKDVSERWAADSVCRCSSERGWLACPGCTPPPSRMSSGTGSSLPWSLARCTKCACQYSQVEEITSTGSSSACFFLLLLRR